MFYTEPSTIFEPFPDDVALSNDPYFCLAWLRRTLIPDRYVLRRLLEWARWRGVDVPRAVRYAANPEGVSPTEE